jgi:hypothetical protein
VEFQAKATGLNELYWTCTVRVVASNEVENVKAMTQSTGDISASQSPDAASHLGPRLSSSQHQDSWSQWGRS